MDDERSLGPKETGSQAAAPIFIAYMKEALKGIPVEQFPGVSSTVLARRDHDETADDEVPSQTEETFYPEEQVLKERTSTPQATTSQRSLKMIWNEAESLRFSVFGPKSLRILLSKVRGITPLPFMV